MVSDLPTINATRLESIATCIFQGLGASAGDAAWIARFLGSKEILIPGEPEARLQTERRCDGVPVEDETWNQIERVAAELGVG